jgi:ADP-ribose pyrophosphatase
MAGWKWRSFLPSESLWKACSDCHDVHSGAAWSPSISLRPSLFIPLIEETVAVKPWKKLSESVVHKNPWWVYKRDTYALPSGKTGEYNYVHTNGSSMVIPITREGKVLLVKQYRYLNNKESIEFPCGSVKDGSSHDETAWHELTEETGYSSNRFFLAGEFNPYNGVTDELCHVYIARDLNFIGGQPDETEEFELVPLTADEVEEYIRSGVIWDGMTIAAWHLVRSKISV